MIKKEPENKNFRVLEKIQSELKNIEVLCVSYEVKERIRKLMEYIDEETLSNRNALIEMIYDKVKITKLTNPEMNTDFYLLYRNLVENRISIQEAKAIYEMYNKELTNL